MSHAHLDRSKGDTFDLGVITLRLLVGAEQTNGAFAWGSSPAGKGRGRYRTSMNALRSLSTFSMAASPLRTTMTRSRQGPAHSFSCSVVRNTRWPQLSGADGS